MFKKLALILALTLTLPSMYAADATKPTAGEIVDVTTPSTVVATTVTKTASNTVQAMTGTATTTATSTETQSIWMYVLSNALVIFQNVLTAVLMALASCALVAVAKHFNIQVSAQQQAIVQNAASMAVAKTEAWAAAHADTPSSSDKLNYAVSAIKVVAGNSMVKSYTNDQLAHFAEEAVYKMFNQTDPNTAPNTTTVVNSPTAATVNVKTTT